jgi:tRNA(adenine34) deaminase
MLSHKQDKSTAARVESMGSPIALFAQDAETIADSLASKSLYPQGPASGMRILTFYINRAGRGMSASRRRNLEKAKKLLSARVEEAQRQQARAS